MTVCDYSFSRPNPGSLKAAGIVGVVRYATGAGKGVTWGEYNGLVAAGMSVTLVQEGGNQPALGGYAAGARDALAANVAATAVGYPANCWMFYVAEDPARLPLQDWPTVDAYFDGVASVHGRPAGAYGGLLLVEHLLAAGRASRGWVVRSWGGISPAVHLCQELGGVPAQFAGQIDMDTPLVTDYGQHPRPTAAPPPAPPAPTAPVVLPKDDEMVIFTCPDQPTVLIAYGVRIGLDQASLVNVLAKAPDTLIVPLTPFSYASMVTAE